MPAAPQAGEPRTIVVPGDGTGTLTFTIPPGITLSVESVLAQVDASGAGGPVTATLSVLEQSGVVIANKRQGEAVDAGGPGSATWALRLADEQAAASAGLAPTWRASLNLESGQAQAMGVTESATDNANTLPFGLGRVALVATWKLGVGATVEANVVNLDTVPHKYSLGRVYVQETATGAQETLRGNVITVAGGAVGSFSFGPFAFGAVLLNLANPLIPTIVNAGTYAITAQIARTP